MERASRRDTKTCAACSASDEVIVRIVGPESQCEITDIGHTIAIRIGAKISMEIIGITEVDIGDARNSAGQYPIAGLIVEKCGSTIYILIVVGKVTGGRLARDKRHRTAIDSKGSSAGGRSSASRSLAGDR